jgi:GT2 family glycosyltransferase
VSKEISIILNLYDKTRHLRRFTETCIWAIYQYTDPADYELIIIDNEPKFDMNLHFGLDEEFIKQLQEKIVVNPVDKGCYPSLNQGAKLAEGKYLVFFENDVIITENWLPRMKYYLDKDMTDAIVPDQFPRSRQFRKDSYIAPLEKLFVNGIMDQNIIMVKRDVFEKVGGWDDRFWSVYGHQAFFVKMQRMGFRINSTHAVPIHHVFQSSLDIMAETEGEKFDKHKSAEAEVIKKEY